MGPSISSYFESGVADCDLAGFELEAFVLVAGGAEPVDLAAEEEACVEGAGDEKAEPLIAVLGAATLAGWLKAGVEELVRKPFFKKPAPKVEDVGGFALIPAADGAEEKAVKEGGGGPKIPRVPALGAPEAAAGALLVLVLALPAALGLPAEVEEAAEEAGILLLRFERG